MLFFFFCWRIADANWKALKSPKRFLLLMYLAPELWRKLDTFPVSHCFRGWAKIDLKVNDVTNCLNKNLMTQFVWYLENEKVHDIETLSNDRVVNKECFHEKIIQKMCMKSLSQTLLLFQQITHNNYCMQEILLKIRYFEKGLLKNLEKVNFSFCFEPSPF